MPKYQLLRLLWWNDFLQEVRAYRESLFYPSIIPSCTFYALENQGKIDLAGI